MAEARAALRTASSSGAPVPTAEQPPLVSKKPAWDYGQLQNERICRLTPTIREVANAIRACSAHWLPPELEFIIAQYHGRTADLKLVLAGHSKVPLAYCIRSIGPGMVQVMKDFECDGTVLSAGFHNGPVVVVLPVRQAESLHCFATHSSLSWSKVLAFHKQFQEHDRDKAPIDYSKPAPLRYTLDLWGAGSYA